MDYFAINLTPPPDAGFCFLADVPEALARLRYSMTNGERVAPLYPADATARMDEAIGGVKLPSLVGNSDSLFIVSAAIKFTIEAAKVGEVEYLPLAIQNHKGRLASRDYFIVNPIGTLDCLNLAKSEITYHDGRAIAVEKAVLDPEKLKDAPDLFRLREAPRTCVMSRDLGRELHRIRATNVRIFPLEVAR